MSKHLWKIIVADRSSIWVDWIIRYRLQDNSIWTVNIRSGPWGWRKLVRLRETLRPCITYRIGSANSFSLWHDPWHDLGPLIIRFPQGPRHSATSPAAPLSRVIRDGSWHWPPIINMESMDITHFLPPIYGGQDRVIWTGPRDSFSFAAAYDVFLPPGPKVDWSSLLVGSLKIPRHRLSFGWPFLGVYPPWIGLGYSIWALTVFYAKLAHWRLTITCSFCVPLQWSACMKSEPLLFFIGRIVAGTLRSVGFGQVARQAHGECIV
ncbi:UNVERIFIED_CONTAM: hypothetical protein Slati_2188500 [Sesamum latifolium]|uniref:Reverse transcriptase zinc-binding domain-containing protein n=1 Tax=Sesamum latifolium TaxID=2727402 RepID=A0AAW2WSX9_9LAMI